MSPVPLTRHKNDDLTIRGLLAGSHPRLPSVAASAAQVAELRTLIDAAHLTAHEDTRKSRRIIAESQSVSGGRATKSRNQLTTDADNRQRAGPPAGATYSPSYFEYPRSPQKSRG